MVVFQKALLQIYGTMVETDISKNSIRIRKKISSHITGRSRKEVTYTLEAWTSL